MSYGFIHQQSGERSFVTLSIKACKAMRAVNQLLVWCGLVCLLLNTTFTALAGEYEVDGEIAQTLFKHDGSVQLVRRSTFTVFVRDCSWVIQTTDHDENGTPLISRETACTN